MKPFPTYRPSRIRSAVLITQNLGMAWLLGHVLVGCFNAGAILANNLTHWIMLGSL